MKTIHSILILFLLNLFLPQVTAQPPAEESRLTPANQRILTAQVEDDEREAFIDLFESQEVGNLHVYVSTTPNQDYFFNGVPIDFQFSKFLRGKLAVQPIINGEEPRAVFRLRGKEEEVYLIRHPKLLRVEYISMVLKN